MIHRKQFAAPPRQVALFVTCMVDMIYPDVGMATAELLERLGLEVVFPFEQTCCGQPAFNAGFRDEARALARRFLDVFEPLVKQGVVEAIVAPSGSCVTMTSHFYSVLFEDAADEADRRRAESLAEVTFELTEFLVDVLGITQTGSHFDGKLTYHACCHLLRELGVDAQPRALLAEYRRGRPGRTARPRRMLWLWRPVRRQKRGHQHRHGPTQMPQSGPDRRRRRRPL